jgi:hypothetical protein
MSGRPNQIKLNEFFIGLRIKRKAASVQQGIQPSVHPSVDVAEQHMFHEMSLPVAIRILVHCPRADVKGEAKTVEGRIAVCIEGDSRSGDELLFHII